MSDTSDALTDVYIIATGWHAGTIKTEEAKRLLRRAVDVLPYGYEAGTVVETTGGRIRYEVHPGYVLRVFTKSGHAARAVVTARDLEEMVAAGDGKVVVEP